MPPCPHAALAPAQFNGFGGKIDPGETVVAAAVREMEEESGVRVLDPAYAGHLVFEFEGNAELLHVHVFTATRYTGVVAESEEMAPQWFPCCAPPLERMWADDAHWLPRLLAGGPPFGGYFLFRGHDTIVRHELHDVPGGWPPEAALAVLVTELQGPITA